MSKVLHIIIITVHTSKAVSSSRQLWPACSVHAAYTSWNIQTTVRNKIGSFEQCVAELRTRPRNQVSITRTNAVRYRRKKSFPDHHIDIIFFPMSYETENWEARPNRQDVRPSFVFVILGGYLVQNAAASYVTLTRKSPPTGKCCYEEQDRYVLN